jgi:nucleotide-binding universal stress UspA family protein
MDFGPGLGTPQIDYDAYRGLGRDLLAVAADVARDCLDVLGVVEVSMTVVDAPPIAALTTLSRRARTIVVGATGMSALRRAALGSVAAAMVRQAHCPVAVVPRAAAPDADADRTPVVVGVDGSPCGAAAVAVAFSEAAALEVDLVAIHCWTDDGRLLSRAQVQEEGNGVLAENLAGYAIEYPTVRVHRHVSEQRPGKRLARAARTAQLLVVGSHGRSGLSRLALGSTSEALVHAPTCPTIVVGKHAHNRP